MNIRTPSERLNCIGLAFSLHWICTQESSSKNINSVCAHTSILREIYAKFYAWIPRFDSVSLICAFSQDCLQMYCILWWKAASFRLKWNVHSVDRFFILSGGGRSLFLVCQCIWFWLTEQFPTCQDYRRVCTASSSSLMMWRYARERGRIEKPYRHTCIKSWSGVKCKIIDYK